MEGLALGVVSQKTMRKLHVNSKKELEKMEEKVLESRRIRIYPTKEQQAYLTFNDNLAEIPLL